jgi:AGZA family xanthine/uracil permease-like MFS transporter
MGSSALAVSAPLGAFADAHFQVEKTNMAMAKSIVGRRFRLEFSGHRYERKGSRFLTEVRAGLATFFAMAYIISVNASITSGKSSVAPCRLRRR